MRRPAYGLRGIEIQERQLLFAVDAFTIDLRLTPSDTQWVVSGQLLGPEVSGSAELDGPTVSVRADLSSLSEFTLDPVPAGDYTLALRLHAFEVVITDILLGS